VKARDAVSGENLEEEKPRGDRPHALVNNQRMAERIFTRDKSPEGGTDEVGVKWATASQTTSDKRREGMVGSDELSTIV
jgi:hypothetical protein